MGADLVKLMVPEIKGGLIPADAAGPAAAPQSPMYGQPGSVQDPLEAALAGHLCVPAPLEHADFLRSPMIVRKLDPDDLAGYRLAQLLGMTAGTAAGLGQAA